MKEVYKTFAHVAGVQYRRKNAERVFEILENTCSKYPLETDNVRFELEPTNKVDRYAIKILIFDIFVGYVPRQGIGKLRRMLHRNDKYICNATAEADIAWDTDEIEFTIHYIFHER